MLSKRKNILTVMEVRALLRRECEEAGSQREWALAHGITMTDVSYVLTGRRPPGPTLLRALGLTRVINYVRG